MKPETAKRELEEYANAGSEPTPHGHALVQPTRSINPIGAQPVARVRDEPLVKRKLAELGAMAGEDWFYRYPVRVAGGGQDWIEGPSIKLANSIARVFGNNITEIREIDVGDAWTFYARFTDLETGFSMERAYRQRKGQQTIKTKDAQRALDQVYQIGQSKAIRNVIINSLGEIADFAFEQARNSLTNKIGKNIETWRERAIDGLRNREIELHRVERVIGRVAKDWLAPDIARIVSMVKAVDDGMATLEETFPPDQTIEKAPRDSSPAQSGEAAAPASSAAATQATEVSSESSAKAEPPPAASPKNVDEYLVLVEATCAAATDHEQLKAWFSSDVQRRIRNGIGMIAEQTAVARTKVDARIKELKE